MYESIATGIKRGSPLILDNLGIVVKVGEANEIYAATLGKTVEELTAAEKQMALLNATVLAGDRLIEQAGGTVESATDSWSRLRVEIKNATDATKAQAAEIAGPLIKALADQLQLQREIEEQYGRQARSAAYVTSKYGRGFREEAKTIGELEIELTRLNAATEGYAFMRELANQKQIDAEQSTGSVTRAAIAEDVALRQMEIALGQTVHQMDEYDGSLREVAASADLARERIDDIKWSTSQNLTEQLEDGKVKLGELRDTAGELQTKIMELEGLQYRTPAQDEELGGLRTQLGGVRDDIDDVIDGMREMSARFILGLIEMKVAADGELTEVEAAFMAGYAKQQGLIDDLAVKQAGLVVGVVDDLNAGSIDATEAINLMGDATDDLVGDFTEVGTEAETSFIKVETSGVTALLALEEPTQREILLMTELGTQTEESLIPLETMGEEGPIFLQKVEAAAGHASEQLRMIGENAKESQEQINKMEGKSITIDMYINQHRGVGTIGAPNVAQASGGDYTVNRPTMFIAGDAGLERALFIPQGRKGFDGAVASQAMGKGGMGASIGEINIFVNGTADAQETARLVMQEFQGRGLMPQIPLR